MSAHGSDHSSAVDLAKVKTGKRGASLKQLAATRPQATPSLLIMHVKSVRH